VTAPPHNESFRLSTHQALKAMIGMLHDYGAAYADRQAVSDFLAHLGDPADLHPDMLELWHVSVEAAIVQPQMRRLSAPDPWPASIPLEVKVRARSADPQLTPLEAFDALIRFVELHLSEFAIADAYLTSFSYSNAYETELDTPDPRTWDDWIAHVDEAVREPEF
jgi:hypothetical protein